MTDDEVRILLDKRRAEIETLSTLSKDARAAVALDQQAVGRLSRMDAMQAQAMSEATERKRRVDLARIGQALARLRDGEYGYCLDCGEQIADGRLRVDPIAERCIACAR